MKRLPLFLIIFLGILGAASCALHHFFKHGGVMELTLLQPYYTPWLNKKGIQKADIFITKETTGLRRWVLGAKNISFRGGQLEKAQVCLGWEAGSICVHTVDMDGLRINLNEGLDQTQSHFSPWSLVPVITNGSGRIRNITLFGTMPEWVGKIFGKFVENPSKNVENPSKKSDKNHDRVLHPSRDTILSLWAVYWDKGKIRFYSESKDGVGSSKKANTELTQHKSPPVARIDVTQNKTGGSITAAINPIKNNMGCLGLDHMTVSGKGQGQWIMHQDHLGPWSTQWTLNQHGKSMIPGVLLNKEEKANKGDCVMVSNFRVKGVQSNRSPMCINAKCAVDQAQVSAQWTGTSGSDFSFQAQLDRGSISILKLHHLWPEIPQSLLTRRWILNHTHGGKVTKACIFMTKKDKRGLDFHGTLDIQDWDLSIMPTLPIIKKLNASSTFNPKGFDIIITKGIADQQDLTGHVTISMDQEVPMLHLEANLKGPFATLFPRLLTFSGTADMGITDLTGAAKTRITGCFPLRAVILDSDIHLNLHSTIPNAGFNVAIGPIEAKFRNSLVIDHCNQESSITGKGKTNGIPVNWSWKKDIFQFSSHPNSEEMAALCGVSMAQYIQKDPIVQGSYKKGCLSVDVDFSPCACSVPWLNWKKSMGEKLGLHIKKTDKKVTATINGSGIFGQAEADYREMTPVSSQIRMGKTFLRYVFTCNQKSSSWTDLFHALQNSGHHQLFFRTPFLRLPVWKMDDSASKPKQSLDSLARSVSDKKSSNMRIDLDLACTKIQLESITMDEVHLQLSGSAPSIWPKSGNVLNHFYWDRGSFNSTHQANNVKRKKSGHVSILWQPLSGGRNRILSDMVDMGSVCNGLGITQRIRGGDLYLDAIQSKDGVFAGTIHVDQIKTKLGALGKLLSSISPTLFTEMFSSGVMFNQADFDFSYSDGKLKLMNAVAKGINLGLVFKGTVYTNLRQFKLKGVAIPSYLINTLFSKFPIIGWIFGGNKGLVSSEFTINGPWNNPKINTVPLSFFKLGFLKNIPFFKKSEKSPKE